MTNKPVSYPPSGHTHAVSDIVGLQAAQDLKAPLDNPAFRGTVSAPNFIGEINGIRFYAGAATPTSPAPQEGDVWFSA